MSFDEQHLQRHARIAGFLFIFYIVAVAIGSLIASHYVGSASFGYRTGLTLQMIGGMSAIPLGFSLYVLFQAVDRDWALAAFIWRVGEGVLNGVSSALRFVGPNANSANVTSVPRSASQAAMQLANAASAAIFPVSVICFSAGSLIFFLLFVRSRFLPSWLSWIGVVGSILAALLGFAVLLLPPSPPWLPSLWAPLAIAEVVGGLILLLKGANVREWKQGAAA